MSYFLAPLPLQSGTQVRLDGEEARHLLRSRRIRAGEAVELQGPDGGRFACTVLEPGRRDLLLQVGEALEPPPLPERRVVLVQAAVKEKAADLIVQKATELGVAALWVFPAERSTVAHKALASPQQLQRWERVAWEACKQCGRQAPPDLRVLPGLPAVMDAAAPFRRWLLDADVAQPVPPPVEQPPPGTVAGETLALLVGPEGGLSEAERAMARDAGWRPLALGRIVLRAETAALAACAVALFGSP